MEVNRLLNDELLYEVGFRGYRASSTETVAQLRVRLRELLNEESNGNAVDSILALNPKDEIMEIQLKLQDVDLGISDLEGTAPLRIRTLLSHINRRVRTLLPTADGSDKVEVKKLCDELGLRIRDFRTRGPESIYQATSAPAHSSLHFRMSGGAGPVTNRGRVESVGQGGSSNGNSLSSGAEDEIAEPQRSGSTSRRVRPGSVGRLAEAQFHKWGLSFSREDGTRIIPFWT